MDRLPLHIPVVYAICNNRAYRILKVNMEIYLRSMLKDTDRKSDYVGMDFENTLDLAALASAIGSRQRKDRGPGSHQGRGENAFASGKPALLDISIDGSV